ncbi:MAG: RNA methyltransferase substrate-binding domain-containing protein, partial [Bdellovibrio sp.]
MKSRVVVGLHAVREALRKNAGQVTELWIQQGTERRQDMGDLRQLALRKNSGIKIQFRSENELRQWSPSHQGVLAKLVGSPICDWEQLLTKESFSVLVLDHL